MKKNYISLGCTFRELLLSCDPVIVATKAAVMDCSMKEFKTELQQQRFIAIQSVGYRAAINEIVSYDSVPHRPMGLILRYVTADSFAYKDWINVGLYNWDFIGYPPPGANWKEFEKPEHVETYSATFSEWREHPDREVLFDSIAAVKFCHTLEDVAVELVWEMTWGGFSQATQESINDLLEKKK